ncbi:aldo/keto reductase [candidate division FCPU426 bacterium]|nr:aldo/keto reductase [candidate division FCPU426 bacterium]
MLNNGIAMPRLGLGVWQMPEGGQTVQAVLHALQHGYRRIDTAAVYMNEHSVGEALRRSGLPRQDVFITTKVWNDDQGYDATLQACAASLKRMGLEYADLYLIHWPVTGKRSATWRALCELKKSGQCRAIGVSNYTIRHLQEVLDETEEIPSVNQVEFSPFLYQKELLDYCRQNGVQLEAYSPLTRGKRLADPVLAAMARARGRTSAQIILRWIIQHGVAVIPKSIQPQRIEENAAVFDFTLSDGEMARIDALDEGYRTAWDPTQIP